MPSSTSAGDRVGGAGSVAGYHGLANPGHRTGRPSVARWRMQKKPAGVTPSPSACDCRLDFRCHRDLRQAVMWIVKGADLLTRSCVGLPGLCRPPSADPAPRGARCPPELFLKVSNIDHYRWNPEAHAVPSPSLYRPLPVTESVALPPDPRRASHDLISQEQLVRNAMQT